nr:hypothetical protein RNT25_01058 [arsenite-oxidising bacterium NT-25]
MTDVPQSPQTSIRLDEKTALNETSDATAGERELMNETDEVRGHSQVRFSRRQKTCWSLEGHLAAISPGTHLLQGQAAADDQSKAASAAPVDGDADIALAKAAL